MKEQNKQRVAERTTLNGTSVNNVALNRNGVPQLSNDMKFLTIGSTSGRVKVRGSNRES